MANCMITHIHLTIKVCDAIIKFNDTKGTKSIQQTRLLCTKGGLWEDERNQNGKKSFQLSH